MKKVTSTQADTAPLIVTRTALAVNTLITTAMETHLRIGSFIMQTMTNIKGMKNLTLEYHDVLRRVRDGKIFRVTSDGDDSYTPASATLDMRQVTCEEWKLPKNDEDTQ